MKNNSENNEENSFEDIKLKGFKELEYQYFSDTKLKDFQKERLNEFNDKELKAFKEFVNDSKTDISIENLKSELNSDDVIKNVLKELRDMGINGKLHLNLLERLKREVQEK